MTTMSLRYSNGIFRVLAAGLALGLLGGCASVQSTAIYYTPYTAKYRPPKPPETPIPILGRAPKEGYTAIGRLAFETDEGWRFLRKSMIYNAQINGADAVILKGVNTRQLRYLTQVPPQVDWVPVGNYYRNCDNGEIYGGTNWVPFFRPGYVQENIENITAIDSEMIVFKK